MSKNILAVVLLSVLLPLVSIAQEDDFDSSGMEGSPVEEISAPSDTTSTVAPQDEVVPESMEEATFDDVSYE